MPCDTSLSLRVAGALPTSPNAGAIRVVVLLAALLAVQSSTSSCREPSRARLAGDASSSRSEGATAPAGQPSHGSGGADSSGERDAEPGPEAREATVQIEESASPGDAVASSGTTDEDGSQATRQAGAADEEAGFDPLEAADQPVGADEEDDAISSEIEIDTERGEVRVPCRFVNPTRQIEVFACHRTGPTHETVVTFSASGDRLIRALSAIGCRSADEWNATSAGDFLRNQGDRVLVLLRWEHDGEEHELPAEAVLADGDTGFSSFVRGFSFSASAELVEAARGVADGGSPETEESVRRLPRAVEITLGATLRERAVFSLLTHPTTLRGETGGEGLEPCRSLQPWSMPPVVDERSVPDLQALVESATPATLIFRRVEGEQDLLRYVRSIASARGVDDRLALYERLEPMAARVDALRAAYRRVTDEIADLLEAPLDKLPVDSHAELAARAELLRRVGRWYASRIQAAYFDMYLEQERHKLVALARRAEELPPELLEYARNLVEGGLRFEPELASREVDLRLAAIDDLVIRQRMHRLELERLELIEVARGRDIERTLAALGPDEDYRRRLFEEDRQRVAVSIAALDARLALTDALLAEAQAYDQGEIEGVEEGLAVRRTLATAELILARGELDLLAIDEELRWARNDLESDVEARRQEAERAVEGLESRRRELEAQIEALRGERDAIRARTGAGAR